jgi:hypothetical protein
VTQQPFQPVGSSFDGGFFAPPPPPRADPPAYGPPGYGPPARPDGAGTDGGWRARLSLGDVPPLVAVAAAYLVLAGVAALWLSLSAAVVTSSVHLPLRGAVETTLLLTNGVGNLVLASLLVRGWALSRPLATGVCAWWVLYWLHVASQVHGAFRVLSRPFPASSGLDPSVFGPNAFGATGFTPPGFGAIATMLTLGVVLLALWAALTAAVLWTPSAARHFS